MSIINITVKNKIAQNPTKEIVCGNSDYVVYFDFDEEWTEHTLKTARFSFNSSFIDVVFEGNTVNVPIITNAFTCAVGVYAGDLQTTTPAIIKCQKSILCDGGSPADPPPDVYNQIVELCEEAKKIAESVEERANNGEFNGGSVGIEVDPTVPDWAKQQTKPTYKSSEVGAYSKAEVDTKISSLNSEIGNVENQAKIIKSDVENLQQQISEEAHFRGYLSTNAKIQALEGTPHDFAYSAESGTKWVYDAEKGWQDTDTTVPDQLTPASDATPLINGTASAGSSTEYARGDHRHPTDTTRVSVEAFNELKSDIETALDNIIAIQNSLIGGEGE